MPHTAELSADIYGLVVREIPQLRTDRRVLALLEASVAENVATVLHILQYGIDLDHVHAPRPPGARRLAQRGVPMAALLRAYRIGSTQFQHWCLQELARQTDDASLISAAGLRIAETTAAYIDQVSEELVSAYEAEKEHWLRNLNAARAARVQDTPGRRSGRRRRRRGDAGLPLRQGHVGMVCWLVTRAGRPRAGPAGTGDHRAGQAECEGGHSSCPNESCAWAWLPLGARDTSSFQPCVALGRAGDPVRLRRSRCRGRRVRRTHRQAVAPTPSRWPLVRRDHA